MVATAKVMSIEEGRTTYRFTANPDWLYEYVPRLSGVAWKVLSIILHYQRMNQRDRTLTISTQQFMKATGASKPSVLKALDELARLGLIYEELEDPEHRDSAIRYGILAEPGQGVVTEEDGRLYVQLLGGWYEVEPARLIQRSHVGGKETLPPQNEPGGKETLPMRSRNFTTPVKKIDHLRKKTLPPQNQQPAPQQGSQGASSPYSNREYRESNRESAPAIAERGEQGQLFPIAKPQQDTPAVQNDSKKSHKRDLLWDKAVELFHQPMGGEIKNWRYNIVPELRKQGITPEQLEAAAIRYKREHPTWHYSLKAVFNNLGDLIAPAVAIVTPASGIAPVVDTERAEQERQRWRLVRPVAAAHGLAMQADNNKQQQGRIIAVYEFAKAQGTDLLHAKDEYPRWAERYEAHASVEGR